MGSTGAVDGVARLGGKSRAFCHVAELDGGRVRAFTTWLVVAAPGASHVFSRSLEVRFAARSPPAPAPSPRSGPAIPGGPGVQTERRSLRASPDEGAMSEDEFWALIDETGGVYERLVDRLAALPVGAIVAFDDHVGCLLHRSSTGDLWCAAYVAMGGCSDDGFDSFRGWLISRGRATFEAALRDPDGLCDALLALREADDGAIPEDGDLLAAAARAHERKTGTATFHDLPRDPLPKRPEVTFR